MQLQQHKLVFVLQMLYFLYSGCSLLKHVNAHIHFFYILFLSVFAWPQRLLLGVIVIKMIIGRGVSLHN
jgi:hypothetical protein